MIEYLNYFRSKWNQRNFHQTFELNEIEEKLFLVVGAHINPEVDESIVIDEFKEVFKNLIDFMGDFYANWIKHSLLMKKVQCIVNWKYKIHDHMLYIGVIPNYAAFKEDLLYSENETF